MRYVYDAVSLYLSVEERVTSQETVILFQYRTSASHQNFLQHVLWAIWQLAQQVIPAEGKSTVFCGCGKHPKMTLQKRLAAAHMHYL